jgi:hypothetical protein
MAIVLEADYSKKLGLPAGTMAVEHGPLALSPSQSRGSPHVNQNSSA